MISQEPAGRPRTDSALVSVVLPLFNEEAVLETLVRRIDAAFQSNGHPYELIFVNDGSNDDSAAILDDLARRNAALRIVHFSRNFGHQAAVQAGLLHASGDAVVVMDSDLQDDPRAISQFVAKWKQGYDVVYAVRVNRKEGLLKRSLFFAFYRVLNRISQIPMPRDAGNFGLIDREVALRIAHLFDRDRFFPGLRRWVGFRQTGVPVERHERHDGRPRVSIRGLWHLAKTAIFSFSAFPLTMFYGIAALSLAVCVAIVTFALYHKIFTGLAIPGWASMTITASFFGALNALGIGILGEYVIRIYDQVRGRPLFIVQRRTNFNDANQSTVGAALDLPQQAWANPPGQQAFPDALNSV